ncbi:MAG: class I SAM-dependent methyltransferase [Acidimicrobiales bacterium]
MLTADFDKLGVGADERLLDLGCGFGRHAYAASRRGAKVVALDAGRTELESVRSMYAAMVEAGELDPSRVSAGGVQADALALPFADDAFDRIVASEVLEHIHDDLGAMRELARVLRPGGTMAVTVPRFGPEVVNWALSDAYHSVPGGHVRIYRRSQLQARVRSAGLFKTGLHHAHGLHSPYWWLRCLVGPTKDKNLLVRTFHRFLVWDIEKRPWLTRALEAVLAPVLGKSLVVYFVKPAPRLGPRLQVPTPEPVGSR